MKKMILFFTLLFVAHAKDMSSCYTVQLLSVPASQNIESLEAPKECRFITIGKNKTLRCGCFDRYAEASQEHQPYLETFPKCMEVFLPFVVLWGVRHASICMARVLSVP